MTGSGLAVIAFIWILLAIGTAWDAQQRGGNPGVWFFVVALTGIFGLFGYVIANMVHSQTNNQNTIMEVSSAVINEEGEETEVMLPVKTNSRDTAIERFKAKCMDEGYRVKGEPKVELKS